MSPEKFPPGFEKETSYSSARPAGVKPGSSSERASSQESSPKELPFVISQRKAVKGSLIWWIRCLIAVAILGALVWVFASGVVRLSDIGLYGLGVCMLLTVCQLLLETFSWQKLLSIQGIRHHYFKSLLAHLGSRYLGLVTHGHVGEFLAAGYISVNTGITFGYAMSSVAVEKMFSWLVLVGFGIWGLQLLVHVPSMQGVWGIVIASTGLLAVLAIGVWLWVLSLRRLIRKWEKLSPWLVDMAEFWAGMRRLSSFWLVLPAGAAVLGFIILFLQLQAVLLSLGIAIPIVLIGKIVALSRIVGRVIPISVFGFGSKDVALIALLAEEGIAPAVGLTVAALWLVCSYLVSLLLSGLCWRVNPLVVRRVVSSDPSSRA